MPRQSKPKGRFISSPDIFIETFPNKTHFWYCRAGSVENSQLLFVRVKIPPGEGHKFHLHPEMEEILYILAGTAEQWIEKEARLLQAGDAVHLARGLVHGTYNPGPGELDFLAVLSPAGGQGPGTVDVCQSEPWRSLRA